MNEQQQPRNPLSGFISYLPAFVQIATVLGAIIASWTLQGREIRYLTDVTGATNLRVGSMDARIYILEREQAVAKRDYEDLKDDVIELRRQSRLPAGR